MANGTRMTQIRYRENADCHGFFSHFFVGVSFTAKNAKNLLIRFYKKKTQSS